MFNRSAARRTALLALVGTLTVVTVALAAGSIGAQSLDDYPDLVSDPPENVQPPSEITWNGEQLLAVKFDGFVTNLGGGALHVEGNPQPSAFGTAGAVAQHILNGSGSSIATFPLDTTGQTPAVQYENSDGHQHWHLMRIMQYSLWDETKTVEVIPGSKIGFCLYDIERVSGSEPGVYNGGGNWCAGNGYPGGGPNATFLEMGVSSGWRDTYNRFISLQWVDVSDVAPGVYYLAALTDPNDIVEESDESNNGHAWVNTQTIVPGHLAQDVDGGSTTGPITVTLQSQTFGSPGSRQFVIESAPANGSLDVAVGVPFSADTVTYTPDAGFGGQDSFEYSAFDSSSSYPANPDPAAVNGTVTIDVAASNTPPSVTDPGDQTNTEGEFVSLQIEAGDDDGDALTYDAVELPNGLTIDPATGLISGTIADDVSPWGTIVTVDDGTDSSQVSFNWTVLANGDPSVTIDSPTDGETVAGDVTVSATATDDLAVVSVRFEAAGSVIDTDSDGSDGWSAVWDSTSVTDGSVPLTAVATDAGGNTGTDVVTVEVDNVTEPPPPVSCVAPGIVEAEDATLTGTFVVGGDPAASGGSYVTTPQGSGSESGLSGDYVEFCFTVATAGEFSLDAVVDGPDGGSNSFFVTVNDVPASGYVWDVSAGWTADQVSDRNGADPVVLDLGVGDHAVRVYEREDGTRLDSLALVSVDAPPPPPPPPGCVAAGTPVEAEAASLAGSFVVATDGAASGGAFAHTPQGSGGASAPAGDYIEFCFTVGSAGEYTLESVVDGPDGGSNSFFVTVDDQPAAGYLWDTSSGFVPDAVSDRNGADPVVLDLATGDHVVRVHLREDGTRLDTLSLAAVSAPPPPPPPSCAAVGSQVEAESATLVGRFTVGSDSGASGGAFAHVASGGGASGPGGDYVEFCFSVASAGDFVIDAGVDGVDGGSDSFFVTVDGAPAAGFLWDIPAGWTVDQVKDRNGADPVVVSLDAGDHTVQVHLREDGSRLDWVQLSAG